MHRVLVVIIVEDVTRASGGFIAKEDGVREVARVQRCLAGELVHRGTGVSCILEAEACARVHWHVLRLGSHPFRRAAVRASAKLALTMFVVSRRPRPVVCALACLEVTHVVNNSGDALNVEPIVTRPAHSAASADARRGMVVVDIAVPHLGRGRQTKEDSKHFLDTWRGHLAWTPAWTPVPAASQVCWFHPWAGARLRPLACVRRVPGDLATACSSVSRSSSLPHAVTRTHRLWCRRRSRLPRLVEPCHQQLGLRPP